MDVPISGIPEKEPLPFLSVDILNFGISSTIANRMTDILINVMIPSRNLASRTRPLVLGVWNPTTATRVMMVLGMTRLNTEQQVSGGNNRKVYRSRSFVVQQLDLL